MFGDNLKQARLQKNMKQSELADILNVKNTTISNWEKGVSNPDIQLISKICKILDVNSNYLFDLSEQALTPHELTLLKHYRELDAYGRNAVDSTLNLEYIRVTSSLENLHFTEFEDAYTYLTENPMYAMGGLDIEAMNKEELIRFANDQYEMDQRAMKLFR